MRLLSVAVPHSMQGDVWRRHRRQMVKDSLVQVGRSRVLSPEDKKTLTDLLRSVRRLNEEAVASPNPPPGSLRGA